MKGEVVVQGSGEGGRRSRGAERDRDREDVSREEGAEEGEVEEKGKEEDAEDESSEVGVDVRRRNLDSCARDFPFHPVSSCTRAGVADGEVDEEEEGRDRERKEGVVRTRQVREREKRGGEWVRLAEREDWGVE